MVPPGRETADFSRHPGAGPDGVRRAVTLMARPSQWAPVGDGRSIASRQSARRNSHTSLHQLGVRSGPSWRPLPGHVGHPSDRLSRVPISWRCHAQRPLRLEREAHPTHRGLAIGGRPSQENKAGTLVSVVTTGRPSSSVALAVDKVGGVRLSASQVCARKCSLQQSFSTGVAVRWLCGGRPRWR